MHPDLDAIAAADEAARREVDAVRERLAVREAAERARLEAAHEAAIAEAKRRIESDVRAIHDEGRRAIEARRSASAQRRDRRRERAATAVPGAVTIYVALVRGDSHPEKSS